MVLGYHLIFGTYGFWLPNDPRGSWSEFVGAWEIFRAGGRATKTCSRRSLAYDPHDAAQRLAAKESLKRSPVEFNGKQALAVAHGFASAIRQASYTLWACAILPDHVHVVLQRHARDVWKIVGHLKSSASMQLAVEGVHPSACRDDAPPGWRKAWGKRGWCVFLNSPSEIGRAIRYVQENPQKEEKPPQKWSFVREYVP
jgi:REP element-mobilizing transposase RayT